MGHASPLSPRLSWGLVTAKVQDTLVLSHSRAELDAHDPRRP
jgi:hypothetical protein